MPADDEAVLSVVMPAYNEAGTIAEICRRVLASPHTRELIVVDDASTDGTADIVRAIDDPRLVLLAQPVNRGKGAALRWAFERASGPFVIIQDADLEYHPEEHGLLLGPLLDGSADVVFGSRFLGAQPHRVLYFWHRVGNGFLTLLSNAFTNLNLTDMETCFKAFRIEVLRSFTLEQDRFGIEPELTARVAAGGWRIYEVGISYSGRTYEEGKKITWRDGVHAIRCILRYARR